jgi:hypothetical protein
VSPDSNDNDVMNLFQITNASGDVVFSGSPSGTVPEPCSTGILLMLVVGLASA